MAKLLQVDFDFEGPFGEEMSDRLVDLAQSINDEPGMIWKIWTENSHEKRGGGVYLFEDESTAKAYLKMHSERLKAMGVTDVRGMLFDINDSLSAINRAPLA